MIIAPYIQVDPDCIRAVTSLIRKEGSFLLCVCDL